MAQQQTNQPADRDMGHIFISYQRESEEQVTRLAEALRAAGLKVWQDLSGKDTGIPYSVKWWEVIRGALHSALGALIIRTEPWENSGPCSEEYKLILENGIPDETVTESEFDDMDALVLRIRKWHDDILTTGENRMRTYLFIMAYRMEQDPRITHLLPGKIGIGEAREQYRWFTELQKYLASSGIPQKNPEDGERMASFLKKAKRKIRREQITRALAVLLGIAGAVLLVMTIRMLPNLLRNTAESDYRGKSTAAIDLIRDTGEYDPVSAMTLLTSDPSARNLDLSRSFFYMQQTMAQLLSRQYPVDFYPAGSEEAEAARALETMDYPAVPDTGSGNMTLQVGEREVSLMQDCAPGAVCWVPERNEVLVAADRIIRAYDLDGSADGIPLEFNYEPVERIAAGGDRIYGITESGSVVCWNNPIPEKTVRRALDEGVLLEGGKALYTAGTDLILQHGGQEDVYPVPLTCNGVTAVSAGGETAAAAGRDAAGNEQVALIRLGTGEIAAVCDVPGEMTSLAFSRSGDWLFGVSYHALVRIDVRTGKADTVQADGTYYMTAPYRDGLLVGRADGMVAAFGSDLRRRSDWMEITVNGTPVKQLAASDTAGAVFAACRGGNTVFGCRRIEPETGKDSRLPLQAEEGMTSNTCVAVSEDGGFVAYGFPNGKVTVWSTDTLNELYECRPAAEQLIALRFEDDGLYALGRSGTVYRAEFDGLVRPVKQETVWEYWNAYAEKAAAIHRRMYELGLTYITPK